jgi:hypothetical protein
MSHTKKVSGLLIAIILGVVCVLRILDNQPEIIVYQKVVFIDRADNAQSGNGATPPIATTNVPAIQLGTTNSAYDPSRATTGELTTSPEIIDDSLFTNIYGTTNQGTTSNA